MFQYDYFLGQSTRIYTRKVLVTTETTLYTFYTSFYIKDIQKLALHILHVQILGTNHCGDSRRTTIKRRESEYYGGNISVSIEGIALKHSSALPPT